MHTYHYPSLHFRAKAFAPCAFVHIHQIKGTLRAHPVANSIKASKVGAGFRRSDDVIGGQTSFRTGETDLFALTTQGFYGRHRQVEDPPDSRLAGCTNELLDYPKTTPAQINRSRFTYGLIEANTSRIQRILSLDHAQQSGSIPHVAGNGTHLVQGASKGYQSMPADRSVGRLQTDHPTEGGGLSNRTTGVSAQTPGHFSGRH